MLMINRDIDLSHKSKIVNRNAREECDSLFGYGCINLPFSLSRFE